MAGVFLSYDRDDTGRAKHFARVLEAAGHKVWWDLHVRSGAQFSKVIEEALKTADAVVVLWSAQSIESPWVRDEAAAGRDSGRLVPVTIDGTQPPLGFRQFQTIDLSRWRGRGTPAPLKTLLADVAAVAPERTEASAEKARAVPKMRRLRWDWRIAAAAFAVILIVVGLALWRPWSTVSQPTVTIRAASANAASQSLARDLAVKVASLQSVQSNPIRLLGEGDASAHQADYVVEVGQSAGSSAGGASVALTGRDGTIIWSADFQPANVGDLKQQVALSVARVLGCAGEAMDRNQRLSDQETFKLYLNACAEQGDLSADPAPLVAALQKVVGKAPHFVPAWRKLLLVESAKLAADRDEEGEQPADIAQMRQDVRAARALDPKMAEVALADAALLPIDDLKDRIRALDRAKAAEPNNPTVLADRAQALMSVGRMRDAIEDSNRAMQLDPLSPAMHGHYVDALAYGGQIDGARQAIDELQRMWPGSSTAQDVEYRFNLRFGDARSALPIAQQRAMRGVVLFLQARLDPSKIPSYIAWLTDRRDYNWGRLGVLVQAFGEFHREAELYRELASWPNRGDLARLQDIWFRPALGQFRRDPRFMQVMAETPLLAYWRTSGEWPDFCFAPNLPYDCKKEAARLAA